MDCGGKRSATPLWVGADLSAKALSEGGSAGEKRRRRCRSAGALQRLARRNGTHRIAIFIFIFWFHSAPKRNEVVTYGTLDTLFPKTTFPGKNSHCGQY